MMKQHHVVIAGAALAASFGAFSSLGMWIGQLLLQVGIPLLILAQVHYVAHQLYLHQM